MADASVTLASANPQLVSACIVNRILDLLQAPVRQPTPSLDVHEHWNELQVGCAPPSALPPSRDLPPPFLSPPSPLLPPPFSFSKAFVRRAAC